MAHSFAEILQARAREGAGWVSLVHEGRETTRGELAARVDALAAHLWRDWGIRKGDRVAWLGLNDPAQLVLLFALARVGGILLPLNIRLAPPEWEAQLGQCAPKLMVHDAAFAQAASDLARRTGTTLVAASGWPGSHSQQIPLEASPDAPVLLVFTSGTTGAPKAAVHTQSNLLANMQIASRAQALTQRDTVLTVLPLFHVGGLCIQTLPALFAGAPVVLHARFTPDATFDAMEAKRPTLTLQVPATMKALIEHPRWAGADLSSLRAVWAGSSLIPQALVDAFEKRGVPVCDVYGSTETGPFSIACGRPAEGVQVRIDNGEVLVRAPNVVDRYWPDTPACDAQGWFHTGDLAREDAGGTITIVGRAKDLIISGGENIHPAEIEAALTAHDSVLECAAFGMPDPQWGELVAVAVVARQGAHADEAVLRAHLEGRIARFKIPRRWLFVESLPKTALGKVQRSLLAQATAQSSSRETRT